MNCQLSIPAAAIPAPSAELRELLEATNDCVFILDESWRFTYLSNRAKCEIQKERPSLIGQTLWEAFPDVSGTPFELHYRRTMRKREASQFQAHFAPLSAWYQVRVAPLRSGGIGVWFRNINERVQRIAALEAAEERFKLAAQATQDVVFDWEISTGKLKWHRTTNMSLGYHEEDLGNDVDWWLSRIHPADQSRVQSEIKRILEGGKRRFESEYRLRKADGSFAEVLVRGFVTRDAGGRAHRMVGAIQDNTQRNTADRALKEREARLSSVFGQDMVGILQSDANGKLLMANERFCQIVGRTEEELRHLTFYDYTHPDDLAWNKQLHAQKRKAAEPFQIEKRYMRPDGSTVWCEVSVSFVESEGEGIVRTIAFVQDISDRKSAEEALEKQTALLQKVIDSVEDLIFIKDLDGRFVLANRALVDGCGELVGSRTPEYFREELTSGYESVDREVIETNSVRATEEIIPIAGEDRLFHTVKVPWLQGDTVAGVIGVSRDVTEARLAEQALRDSEMLYRSVLEASADCIEVIALDGRVHLANSSALEARGRDHVDQVRGTEWTELWCTEAKNDLERALENAREGETTRLSTLSGEFQQKPRWWDIVVSPMCDDQGQVTRILSISRDTTTQRETSAQLKWASEHDALTELPNRRAFKERLQGATIRAMASDGKVGLLLIDLDHFKHVNDTLGHTAGDHLLSIFSRRLKHSVREDDFVARLGGDEFAVILESEDDSINLADAGAAILARLQLPIRLGDREISASASIGGAVFPNDARSANELFDNADIALYALKASGRGGTQMFENRMRDQAQIVSSQLNLARVSVSHESVEPHYQPKVDLETGEIVGFEALLRWRHWARGIQHPASVAEAFKDYELASKISELMQRKVFQDLREWIDNDIDVGRISINAAPVEFLRDDFAERVLRRLEQYRIPAEYIELEVTEHVFLERSSDYVGRALKTLYREGISIALDDFGTGYSSLSHLRDFPVDVVKIDRTFVDRIASDPEILAIVSAVIDLAGSLNMKVVAEGVETEDQKSLLRKERCPLGQGFLFGKAVRAEEVPRLLKGGHL